MLDIKYIREHPEEVKRGAQRKGVDIDIDHLLAVDSRRRAVLNEVEALRAKKNSASAKIAQLTGADKQNAIVEMKETAAREKEQSAVLKELEDELQALMLRVPMPPAEDIPDGGEMTMWCCVPGVSRANSILSRWIVLSWLRG